MVRTSDKKRVIEVLAPKDPVTVASQHSSRLQTWRREQRHVTRIRRTRNDGGVAGRAHDGMDAAKLLRLGEACDRGRQRNLEGFQSGERVAEQLHESGRVLAV